MRTQIRWVGIVVVAMVILIFAKNAAFQSALTATMSNVMHVPVKVGSVDVRFLSSSIRLRDLRVYNPSGYPDKLMAQMPTIFIDFEPKELLQGRAHFKEVRLDLKELMVIRDKQGRLNVDAVKPTQTQRDTAKKNEAVKSQKAPKLNIDKLYLTIGRVTYKDYSAWGEPAIQTFDVNIQNREYQSIQDPTALVSVIVFEALARTSLSKLADLDLHAFKEGGLSALSESLGIMGNSTEAAQSTAKKLISLFQ